MAGSQLFSQTIPRVAPPLPVSTAPLLGRRDRFLYRKRKKRGARSRKAAGSVQNTGGRCHEWHRGAANGNFVQRKTSVLFRKRVVNPCQPAGVCKASRLQRRCGRSQGRRGVGEAHRRGRTARSRDAGGPGHRPPGHRPPTITRSRHPPPAMEDGAGPFLSSPFYFTNTGIR